MIATQENLTPKVLAKVEKTLKDDLADKLFDIVNSVIKDRVYGLPESEYYQRTYSLLNAVDFSIKKTKDSITFELYLDPNKVDMERNATGFNTFRSFDGTPFGPGKFEFIDQGYHRRDGAVPNYLDRIREILAESEIIEEHLVRALQSEGWTVTVS